MFDSYWSAVPSSSSKTTALDSSPARVTACAALDLVSCFHSGHLDIYESSDLNVREDVVEFLGGGGFSRVELGSIAEEMESMTETVRTPVAVKRSKLFPRERHSASNSTFDKHLAELATELRILSHEKLREHPNIADVLGISINTEGPATFLSLVSVYAEAGSLRRFLTQEGKTTPFTERVQIAAQLASGLAAVHSARIAHGDVKTDNALVFKEDGGLRVKLSDFGQSILLPLTEISGSESVSPPAGTPLLNAPEVRNGACHFNACFRIEDAIATDTFSFGLCTWEIIKGGRSFFDREWFGNEDTNEDQDSMISYLNNLPQNHLCTLGLKFLDSLDRVSFRHIRTVRDVFQSCLQDEPHFRKSMSAVSAYFDQGRCKDEDVTTSAGDIMSVGTVYDSLQNARKFLRGRSYLLGVMPSAFRHRILYDLEWIAMSGAVSMETRAFAALVTADFFASGLDAGKSGTERVLHWLHRASELGSVEAIACYDRVCYALRESPAPFEESTVRPKTATKISATEGPDYFIQRIHSFNKIYLSQLREGDLAIDAKASTFGPRTFEVSLFNEDFVDHIGPVHLAAWHAEASTVSDILSTLSIVELNTRSTLGLNATHFAAAGGSIKTLRMLVSKGVDVAALSSQNVTTLHMAIFIPPGDIDETVNFLIESGVSAESASDEIQWPLHRLVLSGTPLRWAVATRNIPMVKALAPHSIPSLVECLGVAVDLFYLDIAQELMPHCQVHGRMPWISQEFDHLKPIKDPIAHWIAHGSEHINIIKSTVQFCRDKSLLVHGRGFGITHLLACITRVACDDDLYLAKCILEAFPVLHTPTGLSPLHHALHRSGDDHRWIDVVRELSGYYTIAELQEHYGEEKVSLFQHAIYSGSVIGVQVLLERGVDVNFIPSNGMFPTWHYWAYGAKHQREMLPLLLSHGLKTSIVPSNPASTSTFDALAARTWNRYSFDDFVDLTLTAENSGEILHRGIRMILHGHAGRATEPKPWKKKKKSLVEPWFGNNDQGQLKHPFMDMLRALLKRDMVANCVNSPDALGMCVLHKACLMARHDVIRILLDVGADPCIPFAVEEDEVLRSYYPLHLCHLCGLSASSDWFLGLQELENKGLPSRAPLWNILSSAVKAGLEVLRSHSVRGDELFKEVDEKGLVWAMLYAPEIARTVSRDANFVIGNSNSVYCSDDSTTTEEYWLNEIKALGPWTFILKYMRQGMIPRSLTRFLYLPEHGPPGKWPFRTKEETILMEERKAMLRARRDKSASNDNV